MSRADVVAAACQILDEDGVGALTMANVASRVGFTTMALYRHVANRDDLVDAAVERALAPVWLGADEGADWLAAVVGWMHALRDCLRAHPWAARLLGSSEGASPPLHHAADRLMSHLGRSPMDDRARARAAVWTVRVTIGVVIQEIAFPVARGGLADPEPAPHGRGPAPASAAPVDDDTLFADVVERTTQFLTELTAPG